MSTTTHTPDTPFSFLSPLDGKTYTLPPFDPEKVIDEVTAHADDFVPKVTLTDALLADDPKQGMALLEEPMKALNVLMKRSVVKTVRAHLTDDDPAWHALRELIDRAEFDALGKIFTEWQAHYAFEEENAAGEG